MTNGKIRLCVILTTLISMLHSTGVCEIAVPPPEPEQPKTADTAPTTEEVPKPRPLMLEIDLADGSHVIGEPTIKAIALTTTYATMEIPLNRISTIDIPGEQQTATVELQNGDVLKGKLDLKPIALRTVFGDVAIPVTQVTLISVDFRAEGAQELVLHYSFDEDKDGEVSDRSGKRNHGRVVGAVSYVDGISGKGIRITQPDAYVESLSKGLNMNGWRQITVSAWFKLDQQTTYGTILNRANVGGQKGTTLHMCVGGSPACGGTFDCKRNRVTSSAFSKGCPPQLGQWYHIVGTMGPQVTKLYINGELDAEQKRENPREPIVDQPGYAFTIGKHRGHRESWRDSYPHGVIDEVKVWKRDLSAQEIKQLSRRE